MNIKLKLYITGHTVRSEQAVLNLRRLAEKVVVPCEILVVDVLEQPQAAEQDKVLATPMVIRIQPSPERRVIGDFADLELVLEMLGLQPYRS